MQWPADLGGPLRKREPHSYKEWRFWGHPQPPHPERQFCFVIRLGRPGYNSMRKTGRIYEQGPLSCDWCRRVNNRLYVFIFSARLCAHCAKAVSKTRDGWIKRRILYSVARLLFGGTRRTTTSEDSKTEQGGGSSSTIGGTTLVCFQYSSP